LSFKVVAAGEADGGAEDTEGEAEDSKVEARDAGEKSFSRSVWVAWTSRGMQSLAARRRRTAQ
jgi:hypothetical protein